jgi:hypothetical protein
MIWKIRKKIVKNFKNIEKDKWKYMEITEENSEKIWKIRKKIWKRYEKYGRNPS